MINIDSYRNSRAATYDDGRASSGLNAWGNSLPAEEVQFGAVCKVEEFDFLLPTWSPEADHVEALGQTILLPNTPPVNGLALLCLGEMGEQELRVSLLGDRSADFEMAAPGWLHEPASIPPGERIALSHLHYPGDYELDLLRPVLWSRSERCNMPLRPSKLRLDVNPLFHIFSLTLLHPE